MNTGYHQNEQNGAQASYYNNEQYPMQPQYQQPTQQQYPPPPNYGQNYGAQPGMSQAPTYDGKANTFDQAFKIQKPKWNDWWAGLLFWLVFAGFVVVSGIALEGYDAFKGFNGDGIYNNRNGFSLNTNTVILFVFIIVVAFVLGWGYFALARIFTKQFIWITGILNIVFVFVTAIYMLSRKYWSGGIVFLIFGIFTVLCFISWIKRIPFSVLMLQTTIDVSKNFGHVYTTSFLGGLVGAALAVWYSITIVAVYTKYEPGNDAVGANPSCSQGNGGCSSAKVIGLLVFITFAMFWFSEVLKNVIHTTISGVYGSWYFAPNSPAKGPTRGAFRRSMTYSFGSISLGSLLVAIINFLRHACSIARSNASQQGDGLAAFAFCILGCLISLLDWAVQFINRYAFSYIALYGKSYFAAAKDTWKLIKDRGIDALVNECLVGPVLSMGALFVAYACALVAYLYLIFTAPTYNDQGNFTAPVVAFAFLIGMQIANIFTVPLSSGIDTIFVAAAWDPQVLVQQHPDLYQEMVRVYPQVQQAIHA